MLTDAELVDGVVAGYDDAFAQLYERHSSAAWRLGQTVTGNADDAADAVAEAFARVLVAVRAGHLDNGGSFRSYLLTATRNAALDNIRKTGRSRPTEQEILAEMESSSPTPAECLSGDAEAALIAEAFRNLPERWRSVLWLTEVEGVATKEAARRLGLSANGAAQLAVRARTGLRDRFLQAHLRKTVDPSCRATVERLGAYVGGGLAPRDLAKVDQHLAGCPSCQIRRKELEDVRVSLRRAALPVPLALGGALGGATTSTAGAGAGATMTKVLAWAQQTWAHKAAAAAAAGALAVGGGSAYMAGSAHDGTSSAAPAAVVVEHVAQPGPASDPDQDAPSPSSGEALERLSPPPGSPAPAPDSPASEPADRSCTTADAGGASAGATLAGQAGSTSVDVGGDRSGGGAGLDVEPAAAEQPLLAFGATAQRQRGATTGATPNDPSVDGDLQVALDDLGAGADLGGDETSAAAAGAGEAAAPATGCAGDAASGDATGAGADRSAVDVRLP